MKQYWVIKDHLDEWLHLMSGDTPEEELEQADFTCNECGRFDLIIGKFSNWNQLKKEMTDNEDWCPYSDEYLQSLFE
ncbi:hypothetical protein LLAPH_191_0002 [Lactococcus phage ASCC191]|uniref:Uncharacterized protein n=1 Tax=Lactococcus phage ASCC191 TaxID=2892347 RepID=H9ED02_9CAUD|nr:hypothetical protein AVV53_gp02 [Lactococcus phage ASCC191]AFE86736.1 hypothetical protein LLAPH_191_0002 [Lactococcus phage ASCC191]